MYTQHTALAHASARMDAAQRRAHLHRGRRRSVLVGSALLPVARTTGLRDAPARTSDPDDLMRSAASEVTIDARTLERISA